MELLESIYLKEWVRCFHLVSNHIMRYVGMKRPDSLSGNVTDSVTVAKQLRLSSLKIVE